MLTSVSLCTHFTDGMNSLQTTFHVILGMLAYPCTIKTPEPSSSILAGRPSAVYKGHSSIKKKRFTQNVNNNYTGGGRELGEK